MTITANERLK